MAKVKYLILGAGAAGLSFASRIFLNGEKSFLVLEGAEEAGGLCRSKVVDGAPLDIGGGHFLDVRRKNVVDFLFRFMPEEEWNHFQRNSQIEFSGYRIQHPIEANLWQMPLEEEIEYLESIALAGCNLGEKKPELFTEWIRWKLGEKIADEYMLPYNRKVFGEELNELGTYWMDKLPDVSFRETLKSCLNRQAYGKEPGHAEFFYPRRYGYGEVWKRMAEELGDYILYGTWAKRLVLKQDELAVYDGTGEKYTADYIITTVPWQSWEVLEGVPKKILEGMEQLKHTGVRIKYENGMIDTDAHWIYVPDEKIGYHRLLIRSNFLPGSAGYWSETNLKRVTCAEENVFDNEYAYPLNTIGKPEYMEKLVAFMEKQNVISLGRWGRHEHYNSDVVVEQAMEKADWFTRREEK